LRYLNRFYGLPLAGEIVIGSSPAQIQRTVPVISFEGRRIDYGLGVHMMEAPGHGTFWGQDAGIEGALNFWQVPCSSCLSRAQISQDRANGLFLCRSQRQAWRPSKYRAVGEGVDHVCDDKHYLVEVAVRLELVRSR
jgi:hypothetical protein